MVSAKILILGITFKEDCPDIRNSKVVDLINEIKSFRSKVDVYDPIANKNEVRKEFDIDLIDKPKVNTYELVVIAVGHQFFKNIGGKKSVILWFVFTFLSVQSFPFRVASKTRLFFTFARR